MAKGKSKRIVVTVLLFIVGLLVAGCSSGTKPSESPKPSSNNNEMTIFLNGPGNGNGELPIVPVKREIAQAGQDDPEIRVKAALESLIEGPNAQEKEKGYTSSLPKDVKVLNVDFKRPYVTVNFSTELQNVGGSELVASLIKQITYTLTEINGVAGIVMQVNGEQVGTKDNPFTGEGFMFDETPNNVLSRPAQGEWMKKLSPAGALDNFIVSIGNPKEMWQWMTSETRASYKGPEELNISSLNEKLGAWHNYTVVSQDTKGNKAVVKIKGEKEQSGTVEKDVQATAYMVKEDGQWKWDHGI